MLGSKIDNLNRLKENEINIPQYTIIKYEDVFKNPDEINNVIATNNSKNNKELSILLKEYVEKNIDSNFNIDINCEKYAVRSSSNIEDGKTDSFAGQFDTYLNVSKENLKEKIIECFKSLYNENVLEYLNKKNIDIKELKMNVIVQKMVKSELSGIVFTANPQGILNESVIVVGEGLGENIVLDKVNATSYYYNLDDNLYYFEGEKDYLTKENLEKLVDISKSIEEILGKYLDIEFAIVKDNIYILQARNITTIDTSNPLILDNSNIVESYPGINSPLTISFVKSVYSGIFESVSRRILKNEKELKKHKAIFKNMVGASNGRLYYKISNWYTLIKFLPFNKKIIPIWQEMLGVSNKNYNDEKVKLNVWTRFMTYVNTFYELARTQKNMKKLNAKFIEINDKFYNEFNDKMDEVQILTLYKEIEKELLSCWDITLLNDVYTFIFTGILKARLKKKYSNYEEKANEYISGITNIESMKPVKELIRIAYMKDSLNEEQFEMQIDSYIKKYGDRNLEELKLESPTFRTNPELLYDKINEYRKDMDKLKSLYAKISENREINSSKENSKYIVKKCTSGIRNREISRLNRSRIFGMVRAMIMQLGKIYKEQNIIKDERDIFYLEIEEINKLAYEKVNMQELVEQRKEDYKMFKMLPSYSRLIFADNEFDKYHANINVKKIYNSNVELRGIPCSNGIVEGEALVINDVSEAKNVKDKILITKMTDPGWVFLLATAKGVISEKGSLLSHTAIISRELKIPSIVGVDKLLDTIQSGDVIQMDATKGIIKIIAKKEENEVYRV